MSCTRCAWSYVGKAAAGDPLRDGVPCDDPNELRCKVCDRRLVVRCGTSRARACAPCGQAYRGRVAKVAGSGLRTVVSTRGLFITLTAPGAVQHYLPGGRPCPCTPPGGVDVGRWNATSAKRWNRLCQDLRRLYGLDLEYFKAAEVQRRGALHYHVLLRREHGGVLAVSTGALRRLALRHGFGHSVDVQHVQPGHAAYVAKYVGKAADARPDVPWCGKRWTGGAWVRKDTGEICSRPRREVASYAPTYRTWTASRRWGDSMASIKACQAHYAATVALLPVWSLGQARPAWSSVAAPERPDREVVVWLGAT